MEAPDSELATAGVSSVCRCVRCVQVCQLYRVSWRAAALQSELAVVLLAAALVLPEFLAALVVRQVQHLVSSTQLLHLQTHRYYR